MAARLTHDGRRVHASREELTRWLGSESTGEPVHIATETADLSSELKRGLSYFSKTEPRSKCEKESDVGSAPIR
jgi:hypothetical protein